MKSLDGDRKSLLRELFRKADLQDLRDPWFLSQLRLAHDEGLIDELLQQTESQENKTSSNIELKTTDLTFITSRSFDVSEIAQFYKINILSLREADGK